MLSMYAKIWDIEMQKIESQYYAVVHTIRDKTIRDQTIRDRQFVTLTIRDKTIRDIYNS